MRADVGGDVCVWGTPPQMMPWTSENSPEFTRGRLGAMFATNGALRASLRTERSDATNGAPGLMAPIAFFFDLFCLWFP